MGLSYSKKDLSNIAAFFCGRDCKTISSEFSLPQELVLTEEALYEICFDLGQDSTVLDEAIDVQSAAEDFLVQLADDDLFETFLNYLLGKYVDNRAVMLSSIGFDPFRIKSEMLKKINALWSIPKMEFIYTSDGKCKAHETRFKEYDKLGSGGFSIVYCGPEQTVYKVLHQSEKSSASSVHRFKREFEIMEAHNDSGYTIRAFNFEPQNLVYSMDRATVSLEDYIENNTLEDSEKDAIILRCVECMSYLHSQKIVHRDFHPGNILRNRDGQWVVTDFGLSKDLSKKYSRNTNSTRAVGRFWFTDPIQLSALKDGDYSTDLYSLAKTIDYIFNGNQTQRPHKYTAVVHKATAPDLDARYANIGELENDILNIIGRQEYKPTHEVVADVLQEYRKTHVFDEMRLANTLSDSHDDDLMWELVVSFGNELSTPFISLTRSNYDLCLVALQNVNDSIRAYRPWNEYDTVAFWAASILSGRPHADDGISVEAARIVEYVSSNVSRYKIRSLANRLKSDNNIDPHIRAVLTHHDGY